MTLPKATRTVNEMKRNIRHIVGEINRLNTRSQDLSCVNNRRFHEEYRLVHNSIDMFVEYRDNIVDTELADIDFDEMVWLATDLEKRYRLEEVRRKYGVKLPDDYEWEE